MKKNKILLKENWNCDVVNGCRILNDYTYGLIYENRIYRISFSRSLLQYIKEKYFPHYSLVKLQYKIGRRLNKGEKSSSHLYAIVSSKTNRALRISTIREFAEELCDYEYRYIAECKIMEIKDVYRTDAS